MREGTGDLKQAYALSQAGKQAFPDSVGGKICDGQLRAISAADYSMESMQSDGLGQRSLRLRHKNLTELHFRAYRADLQERLENSQDYNLLYNGDELRRLLRAQSRWRAGSKAAGDAGLSDAQHLRDAAAQAEGLAHHRGVDGRGPRRQTIASSVRTSSQPTWWWSAAPSIRAWK